MLLIDQLQDQEAPGALGLFVEGGVAAMLGCVGALFLFPDQTGLVSIFLCAIASLRSVEKQLVWNRTQIVGLRQAPSRINAIFTGRVLALFGGQLLTYSALALFADVELIHTAFAHQIGDFKGATFPNMQFPPVLSLLGHNMGVLSLFFALALLFRHGGALLAVSWNASVWGVVFGTLARAWSADGGPGLAEAYARVMLGVFPHMALEAAGYVLVGFAGVFLAQAIARYEADSANWESLFRTLAIMMTLAALSVAFGAAWEGTVAPSLIAALSG